MTANTTPALNLRFPIPRRSIRGYIFSGALLIAAIAFGTAMMVGNFRERALKGSERELENTVLLLARHFDQQFEEFEVVQKELVAYIRSTGIASTEAFKRQMSSQDMREILKSKSNGSPDVAGVTFSTPIRQRGHVRLSTLQIELTSKPPNQTPRRHGLRLNL